jgi:hypothetical protein
MVSIGAAVAQRAATFGVRIVPEICELRILRQKSSSFRSRLGRRPARRERLGGGRRAANGGDGQDIPPPAVLTNAADGLLHQYRPGSDRRSGRLTAALQGGEITTPQLAGYLP